MMKKHPLYSFLIKTAVYLIFNFAIFLIIVYALSSDFGKSGIVTWCILTALVLSALLLGKFYIAYLVFLLSSLISVICHYIILIQQAPHFTQKAGMLLFMIQFGGFIVALICEWCIYQIKKKRR